MSFAWMRRIDFWMGKPLAWLLGQFTHKATSLYGDGDLGSKPRRVICAKFIGLGSIALSFPLLQELKRSGVRVAFWSFEGQADLVRLSGLADEILIIRPTWSGLIPSLLRSLWQARAFKADAFFDLEPTAYLSAILSRLSRAKIRVGFLYGSPLREQLFTHLVSPTSERGMIECNLLMARRLGFEARSDSESPAVPSLSRVRNVMPEQKGRKRIVININTTDLSWHRMWPEEHWVKLCNKLLEDYTVDLVFPGTKEERGRVQDLAFKLKDPTRVFNMAGEILLVELLKMLNEAHLVVTVDGGLMHMAAWSGSPLVVLFGPETPQLLAPRSSARKLLWERLSCSPCLGVGGRRTTRCRDNQCMKRILPENVFAACSELLKQVERVPVARSPIPPKEVA